MDTRLKQAVAVGKFGSFSKAAEVVGVTQSAVTKSVADLERRIGYPLFHRTSKGVIPTEEGRVFLERAFRLITDTADLLGHAPHLDRYGGILRVGVFPGTIEWLLAIPFEMLVKRFPRIKLDLTTGSAERGLQLLERGDIDVALGFETTYRDRTHFRFDYVTTVHPVTFVRHDHPLLALDAPSAPADLARYDMVLPAQMWHTSVYPAIAAIYGTDHADRFHRIESFSLACKVVENTDAMGIVDPTFTKTAYFQARFEVLRDFRPVQPMRVGCALRAQWTPKGSAETLIAVLQQVHGEGELRGDAHNRLFAHEYMSVKPQPR